MSRFYLEDGKEVSDLRSARKLKAKPSVTTVINGVSPHGYKFLDDKRLKEVLKDDSKDYDAKLEILGNTPVFELGLLLHQAAETYWDTGVRSDPLKCPNSARQFFAILKRIKPIAVEEFYWDPKTKSGGRLDLVGKEGEYLNLYDYKTVSTIKKKPETTWLVQLGAYNHLLLAHDIHISEAKIIQFSKKDEGCKVLRLSQVDLKKGYEIYLAARVLYRLWMDI